MFVPRLQGSVWIQRLTGIINQQSNSGSKTKEEEIVYSWHVLNDVSPNSELFDCKSGKQVCPDNMF